jgi:RNA polymerase sigma-70 factor (ECF subfamily)
MSETADADELRSLVARAQQHSPDAWEALYRRCRPKLVGYARRRLPSTQAAEDAVSEAFARAIARIEDFTWTGAGFDGWMYGITRNVIHEAHRTTARNRRLDAKQANTIDGPPTRAAAEIGDRIERTEERDVVRRAFTSLSDADQEILELRVVGGLTADQVAVVLDKKPGAIRMAQSRALQRLRDAMKEVTHG